MTEIQKVKLINNRWHKLSTEYWQAVQQSTYDNQWTILPFSITTVSSICSFLMLPVNTISKQRTISTFVYKGNAHLPKVNVSGM